MNTRRIAIQVEGITTLAEMSAWLAENKPTFVFKMRNPVQYPLSTPAISTIEGDGSAWVTAEDGIVSSFSATYLQSE